MPRLSIITINLNNASGLKKTMHSVLSQTSRDFEYIIIDGGSTDGSVDIIKSFTPIEPGSYIPLPDENVVYEGTRERGNDLPAGGCPSGLSDSLVDIKSAIRNPQSAITPEPFAPRPEPRALSPVPYAPCSEPRAPCSVPITFWLTEPDSGIYQAMNKGIRVARGEYCQFLNSGDWLVAPDVTEKMLTSLPDCGIYYGNMLKQMPKGKTVRDTCEEGNLTMLSFYRGALNHSPAYIKRDLFDKYGLYDESFRIVSDWKWYLIAVIMNNEYVKYTNIDVSCFNMDGISNINKVLDRLERRKVMEEILPENILKDYDLYWNYMEMGIRINKYIIIKKLIYLINRFIFLIEKIQY